MNKKKKSTSKNMTAKKIKELMEYYNLSQSELGRQVGLPRHRIHCIIKEKEKLTPSKEKLFEYYFEHKKRLREEINS